MRAATPTDDQIVRELAARPEEIFLSKYKETYRAVSLLVNPPGAQFLLMAVPPAAELFRGVPWLRQQLCETAEAFRHLPELERSLAHLDFGEILSDVNYFVRLATIKLAGR